MHWREVFAFPLRSPAVLVKLWLLHLVPLVALVPVFLSGMLTVIGAAIASSRDSLPGAVVALGAGTLLAYLLFGATAVFCGLYPLGYLLEVAHQVAVGECPKPPPLGRWMARFSKGLYGVFLLYPAMALCVAPIFLVFPGTVGTYHPDPGASQFLPVVLLLLLSLVVGFWMCICLNGICLRLTRSLNPFYALNPVGILADLWRDCKDYVLMVFACSGIFFAFATASWCVLLAAPFVLSGPLLLIPAVAFGLAQNYFLLAMANAAGQYSRLYLK